jgi:hypothetical protein
MGFDAPSKPIFNLGKQGEASDTIPGGSRELTISSLITYQKIFNNYY